MKKPYTYIIIRPILKIIFGVLYWPIIIGKENIAKEGKALLVGNHRGYLDSMILGSVTKRPIHYFAKRELTDGAFGGFFKSAGVIPVDRNRKDKNSLIMGEKYLNDDKIVAIFPEGTINRTSDLILPFKFGAVKLASSTNTMITPYVIPNKYKMFSRENIIVIGKPYSLKSDDLEKENDNLMNEIKDMLQRRHK